MKSLRRVLTRKKLVIIFLITLLMVGFAYGLRSYYAKSAYFELDGLYYTCSKEVNKRNVNEVDTYCRLYTEFGERNCKGEYCIVEEYRAVLDILKRPDVFTTLEKYNSTNAWVRALHHDYIQDKDYLSRILPAYSHMKIDCIIVFHSPEGTRFFIENGEAHKSHDDHRYLEIESEEFLASLNKASDKDVTDFWLGLR